VEGLTDREQAVPALYARDYRRLVRTGYAVVGDQAIAEEITQDAFVALWNRWAHLREPEAASAYLYRSVINGARAALRRQRLGRWFTSGEATAVVDLDTGVDLLEALGRLPLRKRACVVLRYYADLSEAEVADVLGVSVGTVKSQTHKALRQLASDLGESAPVVSEGAT
jgi:RNA polymerase sigma-70 factor (sigma-E family)